MARIDTTDGSRPAATNDCPPVAGTAEGRNIAVGANATRAYSKVGVTGNPSLAARKYGQNTRASKSESSGTKAVFRASTGLVWAFSGKKGRVLELLATQGQGLTQWDCWPWHTRLGASIHVFREAGLEIETRREGDCGHARYFLRTPGCLIKQAENSGNGQ